MRAGGLPETLAATAEQPRAEAALAAALRAGPSHAYCFLGPAGSGKRTAARAFAAELLATGVDDPERARRRALADPSPHPDLAWLRPPGNQHLVEEVRERVIAAVPYRPFEGERRVFVIEAADTMAEESQNALLKTLEEPPPYAHLLLVSSEPQGLLETVRSRCQPISFQALPPAAVERRLAERLDAPPETIAALAALSGGDLDLAGFLGSGRGARLRELVEACLRGAPRGRLAERSWSELLELAAEIGAERGEAVAAAARERAEQIGKGRDADRIKRLGTEAAKRAERRARTDAIDTALALIASWSVDLVATCEQAPEAIRNRDRLEQLRADAEGIDPIAARRLGERAMEMRRRLQVNVNEELALDALFHRAALELGAEDAVV